MQQRILRNEIRRRVIAADLQPIREHLFPIIASAPVSSAKSISDQMTTALLVKATMEAHGVKTRMLEHEGCYPAVYGEIKADLPNAPTILIGGHYDAQPSDPKSWKIGVPHAPKLVTEGGEIRIFGRGTSDDWGQVLTHLVAVAMIKASGAPLPVNIKILIEGGEESGSPNMEKMIEANRELLACDLVILTDSSPGRMNVPIITTNARGLASAWVELKMGTNHPHSGKNLAIGVQEVFAQILALKDLKTMRVMIPGFYDSVRGLTPEQISQFDSIPFDVPFYRDHYGLRQIYLPDGISAQRAMWAQPSYEWHSVQSSEGTLISHTHAITTHGKAYVSMRLVADQDPEAVFELFKAEVYRRLEQLTPVSRDQLRILKGHFAHPFYQDVTGVEFDAVAKGMAAAFDVSGVDYMGCGGTEPIAIFYKTILGVPVIFNAYNSPADNYHADDESFSFQRGFQPGVVANALIYQNLYDLKNAGRVTL